MNAIKRMLLHAQKEPSNESSLTSRQELVDEIVEAYAARLRRVLSCTGRKPFRLAGLRLYANLRSPPLLFGGQFPDLMNLV